MSAFRLFAGQPERVYAERILDGPAGVDLRLAATVRKPNGALAQFDVGLDLPRRDELEVIGTRGKVIIPDPWLCRPGYVELERNGATEQIDVDPSGAFGLTHRDLDAYRIEFDVTSAAILNGEQPAFGRADAIAQAVVLDSLRQSAVDAKPVALAAAEGVG